MLPPPVLVRGGGRWGCHQEGRGRRHALDTSTAGILSQGLPPPPILPAAGESPVAAAAVAVCSCDGAPSVCHRAQLARLVAYPSNSAVQAKKQSALPQAVDDEVLGRVHG